MKIGLHRKNGVIFRETKYRQTLESSRNPAESERTLCRDGRHPPDRKASADFRRPAYPNYTVEDALKKWGVDTRKGVDAGGAEH